MSSNLISLSLDGSRETVIIGVPMAFTEERYNAFHDAIDGVAHYDRDLRRNVASVDRLGAIACRLREAGFDVDLSPDARKWFQRFSAAQMFDLQRVRERIAHIDDEIRAREEEKARKEGRPPPRAGLYNFQKLGSEWLTLKDGALLADQMGLGKTIQIIAAIPPNVGTLVVCPASLKDNWVSEVRQWRPHLKTFVLRGRQSFRWPRPSEILITNYEILPDIHDREGVKPACACVDKHDRDCVFFDTALRPGESRRCNGFLPPTRCPGCKPDISGSGIIAVVKKRGQHLPPGSQGCPVWLEPLPCPGCHPLLDEAPEGTVLAADEAHMLKQRRAKRTQQYRALVRAVRKKKGRTWGATGTPLENHPNDLWHVLVSLGIERAAFDTYDNFVTVFRGKPKVNGDRLVGYEWPTLTPEDSDRIRPHLQRVFLRRKRDEVLQLPDKIYQDVEVELDRKTYTACEKFVREAGGVDRLIEIIEKSRGEQVGIQGLSTLRKALAIAKIPAMMEFVESFEQQEEPLVIFCVHREPVNKLEGRPGWGTIHGDNASKASKVVADFQAGKLWGIAMTISGGMGHTLTRAANMLRVDHDWRPSMDEQIEDRLMRIGQVRNVLVKTLVANHPLERRIMQIHARKRGFITASVDASAAKVADQTSPLDDEIRRLQEVAAQGGAIRRVAESPEERLLIEQLLSFVFDRRSDERLAGKLADEAQTIGLSDPQWSLAKKVVLRGYAKDTAPTEHERGAHEEHEVPA